MLWNHAVGKSCIFLFASLQLLGKAFVRIVFIPMFFLFATLAASAQTASVTQSPESSGNTASGNSTSVNSANPQSSTEPLPANTMADAPADDAVTMFPHSNTLPYWISGQTNVIFQAHPPYHALYSGTNSLTNAGEYKTSLLGTLYLGWQVPHTAHTTEFLLDMESAGGRGISQALGLAGFTNLDVVRNPTLGSTPYIARMELHQTIGLTDELTESQRNPFSFATKVPVRRLEF